MSQKNKYILGQRYTYPDKDYCLRVANKAKAEGYDIRFGKIEAALGSMYWFEIIDPFEEAEGE